MVFMDGSTLNQLADAVMHDLSERHVCEAHDKLNMMVRACSDEQLSADFEELRSNYSAMLLFLTQGGSDENRFCNQNEIMGQTWFILLRARRGIRLMSGNDLYCRTWNRLLQQSVTEQWLMEQWVRTNPSQERLDLQDTLFDFIWTSTLWRKERASLWSDFILRQDAMVQRHLCGALFLSAWEYPDTEKMALLTRLACSEHTDVSDMAVTGLVLLSQEYGSELERMTGYVLDTSNEHIASMLLPVQKEFALMLASRLDTQREEEELEKVNQSNVHDAVNNVLRIKMKYVKKRLAKGYDPNLSRLSLLHSCRFLQTCSHWFLAFDSSHPLAQSVALGTDGKENTQLVQMTEYSPDCDVDKYSLCEVISRNKSFAQVMSAQVNEVELGKEEALKYRNPLRSIMQNLYRFFSSSPVSNDLDNPFSSCDMLLAQERFRVLGNEDDLQLCISVLMDAQEYVLAGKILDDMIIRAGADVRLLCLRGECYFLQKEWKKAYQCFIQTTFLEKPDQSVVSYLSSCCENMGRRAEMVKWTKTLLDFRPEDDDLRKKYVKACMLESEYDEALQQLYRLDYDNPDNTETLINIVDCLMRQGKREAASKYHSRLVAISHSDVWRPLAYSGHFKFISRDWAGAKAFYSAAAACYTEKENASYADFLALLEKDFPLLEANNIQRQDFELMRDALWQVFVRGI